MLVLIDADSTGSFHSQFDKDHQNNSHDDVWFVKKVIYVFIFYLDH